MAKPKIGVTISTDEHHDRTSELNLKEAYFNCIRLAGGEPVAFPMDTPVDQIPEILADHAGASCLPAAVILIRLFLTANRTPKSMALTRSVIMLEIALANYCADNKIPLFGICRGMQVINVALGGTLYTDITDQLTGALRHPCYPEYPRDYLAHSVYDQGQHPLDGHHTNRVR